jgi:uncharacterized protein YceH (UPF0502 family)
MGGMRILVFVLVLAACGEVRQSHRWPDHRREKDEQIASLLEKASSLEQKTDALVHHASALEARVKQLEQELANLRQPAAPQPAPAGVPSPRT